MYRSQRPCFRLVATGDVPPPISACCVAGLQVTRVPLQSGVFPRPKSSGAHGAFSSVTRLGSKQKLARVRTSSFLRSCPPFLLLAGAPP
jgi:hypothetical protein